MGFNRRFEDCGCRRDRRHDFDWNNDRDDFGRSRSRRHRRRRPQRGPEFGIFFGFPRSSR